jgi:hypothetical protein
VGDLGDPNYVGMVEQIIATQVTSRLAFTHPPVLEGKRNVNVIFMLHF